MRRQYNSQHYIPLLARKKKGKGTTFDGCQRTCKFSLAKLLNNNLFNKLEITLPNIVVKGSSQWNPIMNTHRKKLLVSYFIQKSILNVKLYRVLGTELTVNLSLYHAYKLQEWNLILIFHRQVIL